MIIFLLILSGGIIQHHCTDTDINHAVQITGYDFNGKTWVLSLSKETYFPLTEWIALICSVLVTNTVIFAGLEVNFLPHLQGFASKNCFH